jgi:hypothetical protein
MFWILKLEISILLIVWVFRQVRKPSGPLGRRVVRAMNLSPSRMRDWGLQHLTVPKNAAILDVGCGGGRVQILQGSVATLPFPDCTFDLVTAVETPYYWPDLPANVREILRVLKPGGTFALIAETYRGGRFDFSMELSCRCSVRHSSVMGSTAICSLNRDSQE